MDRKQCVEAIVEHYIKEQTTTKEQTTIAPDTQTSVPPNVALGTYITTDTATKPPFDQSRLTTRDTIEIWLNTFFASKTIKLVLGIVVPETSLTLGSEYYGIPAFRNLARLTFFKRSPEARDGNAFEVTERVLPVAAIDPGRAANEEIALIAQVQKEFQGRSVDGFAPVPFAPSDRLLVSRSDLEMMKEDDFRFDEKDFRPVGDGSAFYLATAEVGLLNFARAAHANGLAFTYGVIPRESADSIDLTLSSGTRFDAAPPVGDGARASAQLRRDATSHALERRNAVVGFANMTGDHSSLEFGWSIAPRGTSLDGMRSAYVQTPAQYALSALVSIPSWWGEARFHVTTAWVGKDGLLISETQRSWDYVVDIPIDFEPLEASMLGIEQLGPELMESRLDPVWLTMCRPGSIVIPGRRLWRSTKVTLGYQTADAISVLPNMKGIIATFREVQNQMNIEEEWDLKKKPGEGIEIYRTVRVWTSQGTLTLPRLAQIGVPAGSGPGCAPHAKAQ